MRAPATCHSGQTSRTGPITYRSKRKPGQDRGAKVLTPLSTREYDDYVYFLILIFDNVCFVFLSLDKRELYELAPWSLFYYIYLYTSIV